MRWLDKLENKFGHLAINNLIKYIIGINVVVYFLGMVDYTIIQKLTLYPSLVMQGEVWRLFTFIFIPPRASIIFIVFVFYLYYMIGQSLEYYWGTFKFNMYYFFGVIGAIIAAFISGAPVTSTYLNMSLFLAFAYVYPDFKLLLFFVLPVKVKYLGYLYWAVIIFKLITGPVPVKLVAIFSLINVFIFFGKEFGSKSKSYVRRRDFKAKTKIPDGPKHRCTICGITEMDDPDMEFRYCIKCDGLYEYCMDHLNNHEHIKDDNKEDETK